MSASSKSGYKPVGKQSFTACVNLMGVKPELGDKVPLSIMRENEIAAVGSAILSATRAFLVDV